MPRKTLRGGELVLVGWMNAHGTYDLSQSKGHEPSCKGPTVHRPLQHERSHTSCEALQTVFEDIYVEDDYG